MERKKATMDSPPSSAFSLSSSTIDNVSTDPGASDARTGADL
jgi:hypothetical protein